MFNGVNMQSMKKRCLLTTAIALILCGITNNAGAKGPIRFGIKAGIQSQSLHASKDEVLGVFSADKDFGYQFGFVARINFPMLYIQPELNYAKHRFTMDMEDGATTKVKVNNIELPILVGWKIAFVRLFAGPVFTLMNDTGNAVQLLMDEDIKAGEYLGCHPCINTSSLRLRTRDLVEKILPAIEHEFIKVKL